MHVGAGQRVLVVGLGASGRAAVALLDRLGAVPVITDDRVDGSSDDIDDIATAFEKVYANRMTIVE